MFLDPSGAMHKNKNPHEIVVSQMSAWCYESHLWTPPGKDGFKTCLWCGRTQLATGKISLDFPACPKNPLIKMALKLSMGNQEALDLAVTYVNALHVFEQGANDAPERTDHGSHIEKAREEANPDKAGEES